MIQNLHKGTETVLMLIPDISGFTRFLNETEIRHSQHITEELLQVLIRETQDELQVAEIEGDAVFFYKTGKLPGTEALYRLAVKVYKAFHAHLLNYEQLRICNCGACVNAMQLSVKFVAHAGETGFTRAENKLKPYGLNVVIAHRLMKNNIPGKDYLLISRQLAEVVGEVPPAGDYETGATEYAEIGSVPYFYTFLEHHRNGLKPADLPGVTTSNKVSTLTSVDIFIEAAPQNVYEIIADMNLRSFWNQGTSIEDPDDQPVYQLGTEHYCLINGKRHKVKTVADNSGRRGFGERLRNSGPFREANLYFIFEEPESNKEHTLLTLEFRAVFYPLLAFIMKGFTRKRLTTKLGEMSFLIKQLSEQKEKNRMLESKNE